MNNKSLPIVRIVPTGHILQMFASAATRSRWRSKVKSIATIAAVAAFAMLSATTLDAESGAKSQTVSMAAGQSFTIEHVKKSPAPVIRVIENPRALVIHPQDSGDLVLLGAERGKWEVTVTRDDGSMVA